MIKKILFFVLLLGLGVISGFSEIKLLNSFADIVTIVFIGMLKTIAMPLVFTSIISAVSSIKNLQEVKKIFFKAMMYVVILTFTSALVAVSVFSVSQKFMSKQKIEISLNEESAEVMGRVENAAQDKMTFRKYVMKTVPSNFFKPFVEGNMLSALIITIFFGIAVIILNDEQRSFVHKLFSIFYSIIFNIVKIVLKIMPLAIWAFAVKMAADFKNLSTIGDVIIYIMSILIANAIQILIVIPLFLKFKKINPIKLFKNVSEGLNIAFMSKSSAVSMPVNIKCFEEKIVKKECNTTRFLFPLCTPLNMNSSSAFIATTVLFLMSYYGMEYSLLSKIGLLFVSTFVVMGNSTIPMATFILTTSFLANLNIPSEMMGIILPFYAMIDPIEATLNAWSDCAVVAAVKKEVHPDECSEL